MASTGVPGRRFAVARFLPPLRRRLRSAFGSLELSFSAASPEGAAGRRVSPTLGFGSLGGRCERRLAESDCSTEESPNLTVRLFEDVELCFG